MEYQIIKLEIEISNDPTFCICCKNIKEDFSQRPYCTIFDDWEQGFTHEYKRSPKCLNNGVTK